MGVREELESNQLYRKVKDGKLFQVLKLSKSDSLGILEHRFITGPSAKPPRKGVVRPSSRASEEERDRVHQPLPIPLLPSFPPPIHTFPIPTPRSSTPPSCSRGTSPPMIPNSNLRLPFFNIYSLVSIDHWNPPNWFFFSTAVSPGPSGGLPSPGRPPSPVFAPLPCPPSLLASPARMSLSLARFTRLLVPSLTVCGYSTPWRDLGGGTRPRKSFPRPQSISKASAIDPKTTPETLADLLFAISQ
jgi:hypothetical protein